MCKIPALSQVTWFCGAHYDNSWIMLLTQQKYHQILQWHYFNSAPCPDIYYSVSGLMQLTSRQQNCIYYMIHQVHPKPLTLFDLITSSYFHITSLLKFLRWQLLPESHSRHCFQPVQSLAWCPSTCNPLPNCTPHSDWCDWLHPIWSSRFPITPHKSHFTWPGQEIFPYFSRMHCDVLCTYINQ